MVIVIVARSEGTTLSVSGAARLLGVHANTIRAWTDQGRLSCIRINDRGDRRYRDRDLHAFLEDAGLQPTPTLPFQSRLRPARARRLTSLPAVVGARDTLTNSIGGGGTGDPDAERSSHKAVGDARTATPIGTPPVETSPTTGSDRARHEDATHAHRTLAERAGDAGLLALIAALAGTQTHTGDLDATLRAATRMLRDLGRFSMIAVGHWEDERLITRATEGSHRARAWWRAVDLGLARICCVEQRPIAASVAGPAEPHRRPLVPSETAVQVFAPIGSATQPWGVLIVETKPGVAIDARHLDLLAAMSGVLAIAAEQDRLVSALHASAEAAARDARELERTATWAAQLQSISDLGARLARLSTVSEIGQAICLELRSLIDYHNVRVYRVAGEDVLPVAWRGEVGEYISEDGEQLRLRMGVGITGWVVQHGVAESLADASADPRSATIPGTKDDLDESMLLAPMRHDDQVIGVIVLSKLGLGQFSADDLRYLEIYASMAAQAVVNADAAEQLRAQSERLERQLETQRELIRVTESILSSLDPHTVVAEIADRLGTLVPVDTLGLDTYDARAGLLIPMYARGVDAGQYLGRTMSDREGVGGWVARNGRAQLVEDELADPRVAHFEGGPVPGCLIVAPLHGRDGVAGILTLERIGPDARFEPWEFELVTLFAGHVSIALANAVAHQAVEHRAMTDALTGLRNQGTFAEQLARTVARGTPFSLLVVDLDDFKSFNDRDGHEAGNRLLQSIAAGIVEAGRETDEVYRYGGDEFAVILPGTTVAGAIEVGRRVGDAVAATDGRITCSIGVAAFPQDGDDHDAILLAADRACYVAKRSGRARLVTAADALELPDSEPIPPPTPVDVVLGGVEGD